MPVTGRQHHRNQGEERSTAGKFEDSSVRFSMSNRRFVTDGTADSVEPVARFQRKIVKSICTVTAAQPETDTALNSEI